VAQGRPRRAGKGRRRDYPPRWVWLPAARSTASCSPAASSAPAKARSAGSFGAGPVRRRGPGDERLRQIAVRIGTEVRGERGADAAEAEPYRRPLVAEQPTVAVAAARDPARDEGCRGCAGTGQQEQPVRPGRARGERDVEVGDDAQRAGEAGGQRTREPLLRQARTGANVGPGRGSAAGHPAVARDDEASRRPAGVDAGDQIGHRQPSSTIGRW